MKRVTYYEILGVAPDAPDDEIVSAFRRNVKQWHPDVCNHPDAEEHMREINRAAEVLCDPERRKRYDRALAGNAPFEEKIPEYPRPGDTSNGCTSRFSEVAAWVTSPFRSRARPDSFRFAVAGFAALFLLAGLIVAGVTMLPLFPGSFPASQGTQNAPASIATAAASSIPSGSGQPDATGVPAAAGSYSDLSEGSYSAESLSDDSSERDRYYNRGVALLSLGMYPEAAESFDQALTVAPDDSLALARKGAALIGLGQYEESLGYTNRALDHTRDIAWIWNDQGIALENLGQIEEAKVAYENAGLLTENSGSELYRAVVLGSYGPL